MYLPKSLLSQGLFAYCLLLFYSFPVYAQRFEFGGGVGPSIYKGDLNPYFNPLFSRPAAQGIFRYNFSMAAVARANLMVGSLAFNGASSSNPYIAQLQPNKFSTTFAELFVGGEYNFFNYRNPKSRFVFGSPYLFGGVGMFFFNPIAAEPGGNVFPLQPVIPFGIGYKHMLNQYWNINFEFGARATFTDFLDNVSDRDEITQLQRGNKYDRDMYMFFGINITYTIREIICPFIYQDELPGPPPTK
jgi:hypothetical protein